MTTKDLVIKLYENLDCRYCRMIEECERSYSKKGSPCDRCRDQILQDLDRLEKYKKAIDMFINYINICKPFDLDTFLNSYYDNEDICLIKEMLKNG